MKDSSSSCLFGNSSGIADNGFLMRHFSLLVSFDTERFMVFRLKPFVSAKLLRMFWSLYASRTYLLSAIKMTLKLDLELGYLLGAILGSP